jgi:ABC-type transport system involved in cytochrome bd biosynthesis fused ATPase/permease subunit
MSYKERFIWIFVMICVLALICVCVFHDIVTATGAAAMTAEEKKAELQEQLAEELRKYYMGGDNWRQCNRLIHQIEELDDTN